MAFNDTGIPVSPINRKEVPIGTLAEAEAEGLDVTQYATCSRPNPVTGVKGCPWFAKCRVSAKGKSGPRNYGVRIIKGPAQGGGIAHSSVDCMWLAEHTNDTEANGGAVTVVAEEGETYEKVTRIAVSNRTGEIATNQWDKDVHREDRRVKVEVQPWPRPGENKELLHDMLRAEVMESEKERLENESVARAVGLEDSITPLDKRAGAGGRGAGRRAAKDGGES